ncbi:dTDP-4-dehydrorhamnose reductase family protein [Legionella waltersii]|uniref:dTDP-4-dehydrorhamnose reductase n=1 Tax=Legionella waltersii TaxID=66969 RepID=A0A0W1AN42_9GAMM|nr:SDR family oxidoreductase [Legionella waltersii]KTD82735.1 dTDP-4-dehydrorhamnose reductase [Legionella waltersii]SNV00989.1 dTDP-4-dehydrorhamnose reductase [Legionella waltersii]
MNVLVLGVSGTIGHSIWTNLHSDPSHTVWGSIRNTSLLRYVPESTHSKLFVNADVLNPDQLLHMFNQSQPDLVINCTGLIKQLDSANDPAVVLPINSIFPHRLAELCHLTQSRLIQISTDCVFSGKKGSYVETDLSDAEDLYGKSKSIGEIHDKEHVVTLRTSTIGHELDSSLGLVDWFLSQKDQVKGYSNAIFSGLTTIELARVIRDFVIPNPSLQGLYHLAAEPISKYDLLHLVAEIYGKKINILKDENFRIDRSLNADKFRQASGYIAPAWPSMITTMHQSQQKIRSS